MVLMDLVSSRILVLVLTLAGAGLDVTPFMNDKEVSCLDVSIVYLLLLSQHCIWQPRINCLELVLPSHATVLGRFDPAFGVSRGFCIFGYFLDFLSGCDDDDDDD